MGPTETKNWCWISIRKYCRVSRLSITYRMSLTFNVGRSTLSMSLMSIRFRYTVKNLRKLRNLKTLVSSRWDRAGIQSLFKLPIRMFMYTEITNTGNWHCLKKLKPKRLFWRMRSCPHLILISCRLRVKVLSLSQKTVKSMLGAGTNMEILGQVIRSIDLNHS